MNSSANALITVRPHWLAPRRFGNALAVGLDAIQKAAVVLATFLAVGVVFFTPSLQWSSVLEDRISATDIQGHYSPGAVPAVVQETLSALSNMSFPRSTESGSSFQVTDWLSLGSVNKNQAFQFEPTLSSPFSVIGLCAKSKAIVETVFPGACTFGSLVTVGVFDRVLLFFDEQSPSPMGPTDLRSASTYLDQARFVRATVTVSNSGRAIAENVAVVQPQGYHIVGTAGPIEIAVGSNHALIFETDPAAPNSPNAAAIENPTFAVHSDPTGPLDPTLINRILAVLVVCCVTLIVFAYLAPGP